MISKELLSEVLGYLVTDCNIDDTQNIWYVNTYVNNELLIYDSINIYELAHKCKEWAWTKSYVSSSGIFFDFESNPLYYCKIAVANVLNGTGFEADTEPEAIFKACEWILANK